MISVDAKCPIAAPRNSRCNPNSDIKFTTVNDSAGTWFEVAQVDGVQSGGGQQVGEQLLMHPIAATAAVFVELDGDKRRPWPDPSAEGSPTRADRPP